MDYLTNEEEVFEKLAKSVETHDVESSRKAAEQALELGIEPIKAIEGGLWKGMKVVGDRFDDGEIFLPEVLLSVEAINGAIEVLVTSLDKKAPTRGSIVIGVVEGDIHAIGKDIVSAMLSAAGFKVFDLGEDVPANRFVEKTNEVGADIVACSALMTTTKPRQREIVKLVKEEGVKAKVMVGGGPVSEEWAREINAKYGNSASDAVKLAIEFIKSKQVV